MPPIIGVKSLYRICVDNLTETLFKIANASKCSDNLRKYLISTLHAGIRQDLITDATRKYQYSSVSVVKRKYIKCNTYKLFDLLGLLLDNTIKILNPLDDKSNLWIYDCLELFSRLENCQAIGLEELSVKVRINPRNDLEFVSVMNSSFHRTLVGMQNLRVLVLRSVCDNEVLRLLAVHCPRLEHLDVTSSWLVDDKGIKQLLLKNPSSFVDNDLSSSSRCQLTSCCRSLKVVRIQDTNTTELGVMLLLLFVPELRSLGGFIYYRSIGDAILSLINWNPELSLKITDLCDTCLPPEKSSKLVTALPELRSLYSRGTYLPNLSSWQKLTCITIDFDFIDFGFLLEDFLQLVGNRLKKLILVDQVHPIELSMICTLCPVIQELSAMIACDVGDVSGPLNDLEKAKIRLATSDALPMFLSCTPALRTLEILDQIECYLDDYAMTQAVKTMKYTKDPPELQTFAVRTECSLGWTGLMELLDACSNLNCVGDLYHWTGLTRENLEEIENIRASKNWDLSIIFQGAT